MVVHESGIYEDEFLEMGDDFKGAWEDAEVHTHADGIDGGTNF